MLTYVLRSLLQYRSIFVRSSRACHWHYFKRKIHPHSSKSEKPTAEWAIIELQGDLKSHTETSFEGKFIGDLHFTKTGTPLLIIGHHLLYGKETKLEKPFALMEKKVNQNGTEYEITCIIRNKIIFKTRPKPIVAAC